MTPSRPLHRRSSSRRRSSRLPLPWNRATTDWRTAAFLAMVAATFVLGGASRPGVLAQPMIRAVSFIVLVILALGADLDWRRYRTIILLLAACLALPLIQLIPLPPAWWTVLPGRSPFAAIGPLIGGQPWRPLSIVPDATVNALFSLVVPVAFLASWMALTPARRDSVAVPAILAGIAVSAMVALFQLGDAGLDNPLINETPGIASGLLANRNHQAVLLVIGILLVPAWLTRRNRPSAGRLVAAILLVAWFALMILAAGSRAGLAFGAVALLAAAWPMIATIRRTMPRTRRLPLPAIIAGVAVVVLLLAFAAFSEQDRAVQRLFAQQDVADLRVRTLPTIWSMLKEYFPVGSGMGGFDPLFRLHEPLALLKFTYFNHAHDDALEIALDGGIAGIVLMLLVIGWWIAGGVSLLRTRRFGGTGSAGFMAILLIFGASVIDYPLRTPLFMVLLVQAALWLRDADVAGSAPERGSLRSTV